MSSFIPRNVTEIEAVIGCTFLVYVTPYFAYSLDYKLTVGHFT